MVISHKDVYRPGVMSTISTTCRVTKISAGGRVKKTILSVVLVKSGCEQNEQKKKKTTFVAINPRVTNLKHKNRLSN